MERYHITRSHLGFDSCVIVSARYNARGIVLNRQTLYPALSFVLRQLPALSIQVEIRSEPKEKPRFVRVPHVSLDDVVSFVEERPSDYEESLNRLIATQLSQSFELGALTPLWRLVVVSGCTVIFAYNHGIGDGQSGIAFHRALLCALNSPSDTINVPGDKVPIPDSLILVPPIEELTSVSVSFLTFLETFFNAFAPMSWTKKATAWTGNPVAAAASLETNVRCWEIPASDVTQLLRLCREHKTTLTAFFHTLLIGVCSRHLTDVKEQNRALKTIAISIPVSLRRFTGASPYVMCDHASGCRFYEPITPLVSDVTSLNFPWSTASDNSGKVQSGMNKNRETIGTIRYLFTLGISEEKWKGALGKKRDVALELSNVGRFPTPQTDSGDGENTWTISSVYFAQCDSAAGSALKINMAGSPTGTVNIAYTWGPGAIEDSLVNKVIEEVGASLSSILASSTSHQ